MSDNNEEKDKYFTLKDLYEEFWKCRDFEIDHLWQRSVFLAVFLIAVAAAYGVFVNTHITFIIPDIITNDYNSMVETFKNSQLRYVWLNPQTAMPSIIFHSIAFSFCVLGIMFSQLWIMMAKGSKRWYERYENAITRFYQYVKSDDNFQFFEPSLAELIRNGKINHFGNHTDREVDDYLRSSKGGNYSVSKINTFIGQLICFVWIILGSIHLFFVLKSAEKSWCIYVMPAVFMITIACLSKTVITFFTHSGD